MKVIEDINIDWQSTPALWMAYRGSGERIKHRGMGKTETLALADLLEQELDEIVQEPSLPEQRAMGVSGASRATETYGMLHKKMTFNEWWYDHRIKNGWGDTKQRRELARAAWEAAAAQDVPAYVLFALAAANGHATELREAWRRGVIDERDGQGGTRSNRNVDVEVGTRRALEMLAPVPK